MLSQHYRYQSFFFSFSRQILMNALFLTFVIKMLIVLTPLDLTRVRVNLDSLEMDRFVLVRNFCLFVVYLFFIFFFLS